MAVKKGDVVKVEYEGTLDDGTVFDSSDMHEEPFEFEVGGGQVIKGFEDAVLGMEEGEEKEFKIQPSEAYGEPNPKLVKEIPIDQIPKDEKVEKGMMLIVGLPDGKRIPATVLEVTEKTISIDLNHPLAGKVLNFKIKVVKASS